jgi:hypothetical protein
MRQASEPQPSRFPTFNAAHKLGIRRLVYLLEKGPAHAESHEVGEDFSPNVSHSQAAIERISDL